LIKRNGRFIPQRTLPYFLLPVERSAEANLFLTSPTNFSHIPGLTPLPENIILVLAKDGRTTKCGIVSLKHIQNIAFLSAAGKVHGFR
jgi:hypothetical protein